jgi:hypothetical protein
MRKFPRATRMQIRLGNVLPDVTGEIDTRPTVERVRTELGLGPTTAFVAAR